MIKNSNLYKHEIEELSNKKPNYSEFQHKAKTIPSKNVIKQTTPAYTVYSTTNYSQFKKFKGNRPVSEKNLNNMINQIKIYNALAFFPIMISSDGFILDGQHRLEAAKKLGLPVFFQTIDQKASVKIIQSVNAIRNTHTIHDKMHIHINKEDALDEMRLIEIARQEFEGFFTAAQIGEVLCSGYTTGNFIKKLDSQQDISLQNYGDGMEVLKALFNSENRKKWSDQRGVCKGTVLYALSKLSRDSKLKPSVIISRVEQNIILWEKPTDRKNATEMILRCYNYNLKKNLLSVGNNSKAVKYEF